MKQLIKMFLLFILVSGTTFAGVITVTSPTQNSQWCINDSTNKLSIRWNETPHDHHKVKIRLFDSTMSTRIIGITDDTDNNGSFEWVIPTSVAPGQYTVKIRSLNNEVTGYSKVFTIKACSGSEPFIPVTDIRIKHRIILRPDLKISIICTPDSPAVNQNTNVRFKVENIGNKDSKATSLRVFMGLTNTDTWPIPVIRPGRFYSLDKKLNPSGPGYILWKADVDSSNSMGDTNRSNNTAVKKMIIRGPDLKIIKVRTPDYKKTIQQKCILYVTVENIGHADAPSFDIDCDWKTCPLIAQGRKYKVYNGTLKPGHRVTFKFTHRYACLGMKYPSLYVDKANKVKEENENNNKCGGVFHLSGENIVGSPKPWESGCNNN